MKRTAPDRPGDEYALRRRRMVEEQLVPRGIRDSRTLDAMLRVPRHLFVEEALREKAYSDNALPIGHAQTITQPYVVALMLDLLQVDPRNRVLEIGTGSGYQTAVLAALADAVHTVERIRPLSQRARAILGGLGLNNVRFRVGDGTAGWPEEAPFDRIVVAAGAPSVPAALLDHLVPGGRLVIPVGNASGQTLQIVMRGPSGFRTERREPCRFVKLIGRQGWREPAPIVS